MRSPLDPEASISASRADGSSPGSNSGPLPRRQEPLPAALQTPEYPDSDASAIEKVKQAYPLPAMDTLRLTYEQTPAGPIKVHQQIRRNGKIKRVPVATPFGVLARLRLVDESMRKCGVLTRPWRDGHQPDCRWPTPDTSV